MDETEEFEFNPSVDLSTLSDGKGNQQQPAPPAQQAAAQAPAQAQAQAPAQAQAQPQQPAGPLKQMPQADITIQQAPHWWGPPVISAPRNTNFSDYELRLMSRLQQQHAAWLRDVITAAQPAGGTPTLRTRRNVQIAQYLRPMLSTDFPALEVTMVSPQYAYTAWQQQQRLAERDPSYVPRNLVSILFPIRPVRATSREA